MLQVHGSSPFQRRVVSMIMKVDISKDGGEDQVKDC